ncbi:Uncharacterised protein [Campylobacter sputorum subsp. bubulus]|uniref:Uncharacterized protein n=1 Tax=Campylobacter sputorum subsp. sputorum TaxID=32024 RepID=A0A381DIM9_9BACT|nr:hypothetical protein [Campylobacter sputorum]ASM35410.1 hypothetical protein CSPUT_1211 [Campylobacter sputorum aubsp. sputorum RM3237]KAB0582846.1 hypothetical protein F7P64_01565 [Campylobacter sputorum subsp. sputorum]QEL05602.1 hypothetical protein CSPT_1209 [Campylobacter sputorum subsp. sputorum]SUX08551.1 Uncharacterised protein [Campylobacter sputorum subsp. bubulus]SUX10367.1 Uncharacterised protein [Campylobacter sputorum subsp. sputorum]
MNDFFDSLKEIRKELQKDVNLVPKKTKKPRQNPNRDEFKDIFKDEDDLKSHQDKLDDLKDEFLKYAGYNNIKKI